MDAAGVGLSAVTLFVECIKTYKLFAAARCRDSDLNILKAKFQIEETRLTQWGFYWGYRSSDTECTLNASLQNAGQNVECTVRLTLRQISTLLKKYAAVSEKYDGGCSSNGRGRAYRGAVWAIKDKETLESTVQDLADFNNALYQLLPRKCEESLAQVVACALTKYNDGGDLDDIIAAAASLSYADAAKLARFKKAYQMLALEEEQRLSPLPMLPSPLELETNRFNLSSEHSSSDRTFAKFDGNLDVIIEWKAYHPAMLSGSQTAQITLRARVSHLAELMSDRTQRPEGFNVLTCIGYFDQTSATPADKRFGFAYRFPQDVLLGHMPLTLHKLFARSRMPDLGTRFSLALSLSRTLNLLHTSGWLHKSIRSNNIAFFQALGTNRPIFKKPYLLGFGYSRPDGYHEETFLEQSAVASTNQLYRHPQVQGQRPRRYVASDDIYSLGLVLLEIALWERLSDIEGRTKINSQDTLNMERIKAAVSTLAGKVGTIYKKAVEKCLDLGLRNPQMSDQSTWNAERLRDQNVFYWEVVKKLEECRA